MRVFLVLQDGLVTSAYRREDQAARVAASRADAAYQGVDVQDSVSQCPHEQGAEVPEQPARKKNRAPLKISAARLKCLQPDGHSGEHRFGKAGV